MTALDQERCANAVLRTCRDRSEPALRAAIDSLPDPMRLIAGYHRGWWDEHGKPTRAGGKAIRPALALLSGAVVSPAVGPAVGPADSPAGPGDLPRTGPGPVDLPGTGPGPVGGAADRVVPAAVAVELVHDFSLLHDDVMDRDATRRHRPTAWAVFGVGEAILAGDALLTLALDVLARSGHPAASEGIRLLSDVVQELVDGQVSDLAFERRDDVGLAECLRMAEAKTGALLGGACALGALFAGAPAVSVRRMRGFGRELGLAFQLVDDLLGIWGDPATTGKPARSDLRCRKKSLPVVAALTSGTSAGQRFGELYRREGELSEADLVLAAELIELAGGRSWCRDRADILATQAMHRLPGGGSAGTGGAASSAGTELGVLARLILDRDH